MDLSQQELPLTAYFTRSGKEVKPRTVLRKTARPVELSQSEARSPKRRRTKPTASSSTSHARPSKPSPTTLQLPTPAASARKRVRGGQLPGTTRVASTGLSSVEPNTTTLTSEKDFAQPDSGSAPSKLLESFRERAQDAVSEVTLATPSTDWGRTTEPIGMVFSPGCRLPNNAETYIITPRTSSRRAPNTMHGIHDNSPLTRSNDRRPPSKPSQLSSISSCSRVAVDCYDPFRACEKNSGTLLPREDASLPLERRFIQSETSNGQASDVPLIPAIPVPSSQSQYLLHLDATPKHKRYPRRMDYVVSSQSQEEVELMLVTSRNPAATVSLLVGHSPAKYTPPRNARVPRVSSSKRKNQRGYTLPSIPIGSPVNSPSNSPRFSAKNKASDELPSNLSSPSRRNTLTPPHSPSRKSQRKTRQSPVRHESIENIHIEEDSLTEPESELDIFQVPPRTPVPKDACTTIRRGFAQGNLPSTEDDSATEAESDTEFRKCLAEIGRKPLVMHRYEVSKEHTPPPPVISPLVSPTRPSIAIGPSSMDFTQFSTREGTGLSVPSSWVPLASALEQIRARPGSLPSVVRDFVRMFPGDESYPVDFPESLRV